MQTSLENLGQLERRLNMAVPVEEIDKQVDERLKKLSRSLRMAGFRPGKVPLKLVAQQYGTQVRSEVVGDAVQNAFSDAVRDRTSGWPAIRASNPNRARPMPRASSSALHSRSIRKWCRATLADQDRAPRAHGGRSRDRQDT